ncbi:MAG: SGNH/GDSL hydrolase family protein [Nitrosomonas sp.]|nr:SGNH/GDSL hydrolase family protein [Nitrosomonas sp.]
MQILKYPFSMLVIVFMLCFSFSAVSFAQNNAIDRIVTFGTSLSDAGNAFVILSDPASFDLSEDCGLGVPINKPPYDSLDIFLVPDGSYAKGGYHFSNGATWIEQLARGKGLSGNTLPALRDEGVAASNYAVGGARANDHECRFNLNNQLNAYLDSSPAISDNTLFVLEMGGNDIRDALVALSEGGDPIAVISAALANINAAIESLSIAGAKRFLVVNAPAIGETPAVRILDQIFPGSVFAANSLTDAFNAGLMAIYSGWAGVPGVDMRLLDFHTLLDNIITEPASFSITNVEDACITPNIPPFQCLNPDTYLFWDGTHPTKVVHGIMAQKAAEVLMAPAP